MSDTTQGNEVEDAFDEDEWNVQEALTKAFQDKVRDLYRVLVSGYIEAQMHPAEDKNRHMADSLDRFRQGLEIVKEAYTAARTR